MISARSLLLASARPSSVLRAGLLLLVALAPAAARAQCTVEGIVALSSERYVPVMNKRYQVVTQNGILSMNPPLAVVYLEGRFPPPPPGTTAEVGQRDMAFVPSLLPVQAGTRVEFPNHDDQYHNIFSFSPAKRFDLGRYRRDELPVPFVLFDRPGLVVLHCDIHEHMRGLILVLDTPHFVVTDPAGRYRLAGLPAGHYVLKVWRDSRTTYERPVDLRDGEPLKIDFP